MPRQASCDASVDGQLLRDSTRQPRDPSPCDETLHYAAISSESSILPDILNTKPHLSAFRAAVRI